MRVAIILGSKVLIYDNKKQALEHVLESTKGNIRVAMPLGIGKPNHFINDLYDAVKAEPSYKMEIFTALSLLKPSGSSELEERFLGPLVERLYGNYPDLNYMLDIKHGCLPENITVHEFFLKSGDWLKNDHLQQNYISTNYTHIARDIAAKEINILAQEVAGKKVDGQWKISLSCNPDVTMEVLERLEAKGKKAMLVGMINEELPFMPGSAEVDAELFDVLIADPSCNHTLFCTPNMKVNPVDYAIGLHASSLVTDGGTIQIGIGSLGDAIAQSLILRDQDNDTYKKLIEKLNHRHTQPLNQTDSFKEGIYGCSEMFVNGLLALIQNNIIRREVTDKEGNQRFFHGGFFIGPQKFYQDLRDMPEDKLAKIDMNRISFINQLYGDDELKKAQRKDAAFINTCMMVTLSGAAISDALDNNRVVSGVGGQYNFVAMAHEIDGARSIMMLRSHRMVKGEAHSNIVTHYGHCTIPRHLRDIVVTEYGIADLRAKSDSDVIKGLIGISDARFQEELREWAVHNGKLDKNWQIPDSFRNNTPEYIQETLKPYHAQLPDFPFGHDFTDDELVIIHALQHLKQAISHPLDNIGSLIHSLLHENDVPEKYLERMGFNENDTLKAKLLRKLFAGNL